MRKSPSQPGLTSFGAVQSFSMLPQGVLLHSAAGDISLEAVTPHILRLRCVRQAPLPPYFSYATVLEPQPVALEIEERPDEIILRTPALAAHITRQTTSLRVYDHAGQALMGEITTLGWNATGAGLWQELPPDAQCYGLGERSVDLALRGCSFQLVTSDPEPYHRGADPLYINIPFLITVHDGRATGIFFDSTYQAQIDLGKSQPDQLSYHQRGPELRLDIISGPGLAQVVARYTELTGRLPLPPRWVLGYHQSRWSYETAAIVRTLAQEFRRRELPCDAIHLDIDYMDGFRCFTWNPTTFPDPAGLIADLHAQDFKAVAMIDPGIKTDPAYWVCAEGLAQDMFCKLPDGALFHGPVWPGECYFPDFTNPRVRQWWGGLYRGLVDLAIDGFWNDMNEPTVFGKSTMPDAVRHDLEGRGGDHREAHSVFGMQMVRATFEGLNRLRPDRRNWVFTRSAYAGAQRYASCWTGDNFSEWDHLRLTPAMLLNLGLSGQAFSGADVGGFAGEPTPELFARWISMAAFTPFFRTHAAKNTPQQEPWSFGPEVEAIARTYLGWRYRLLPYLYTTLWQHTQHGAPLMRPLLFIDPQTYAGIDDQWLLGDHLLVSPVLTEGAAARALHLPPGLWYDFWTDEPVTGPAHLQVAAALDRVPVHVAAGAVLPLGPLRQHSGDLPAAPLELHLYPGNGESWLYEDDGDSLAYQQGAARRTCFHLRQEGDTLTLARAATGSFAPAYTQMRLVVHGAQPVSARIDGQPLAGDELLIPADGWAEVVLTTEQSKI